MDLSELKSIFGQNSCVCLSATTQSVGPTTQFNFIFEQIWWRDIDESYEWNCLVLMRCVSNSFSFSVIDFNFIYCICCADDWDTTPRENELKCLCVAWLLIPIQNFRFQFSMCFYRVCLNLLRLFTKTWPKLWTTSDWRSCTEWWQMLIGSASHQSSNEAETFASLPSFVRRRYIYVATVVCVWVSVIGSSVVFGPEFLKGILLYDSTLLFDTLRACGTWKRKSNEMRIRCITNFISFTLDLPLAKHTRTRMVAVECWKLHSDSITRRSTSDNWKEIPSA